MNVYMPHTLEDLWEILSRDTEAKVFAGGTDIFPAFRRGAAKPSSLICLERIDSMRGIEERGDEILIGSLTTHAMILRSPIILKHAPILTKAVSGLGSPQIRNMGTIGGNIVTASPAGDTLPPLYVLNAQVEIKGAGTSRLVPVRDFIKGPGRTDLRGGEIVTGVRIGRPSCNIQHHEKVGRRKALSIATASLAALMKVSASGEVLEARLAWGSLGPTVVVSGAVEESLKGRRLTEETLRDAAALAQEAVSPISDIRGSEEYRRRLAGNLLLRLIQYKDGSKAPIGGE